MGADPDISSQMVEIGAMIVHAREAQAVQAETAVQITRHIDYSAQLLTKLHAEIEQVGPRAAQAATDAVRAAVQRSLAGRVLAFIATIAFGASMLIPIGIWGALAWQRSEVTSLAQEKADLSSEIATMKQQAKAMKAKGMKIVFTNCKGTNGVFHICIPAQPGTPLYGTTQKPFFEPKGY